MSVAPDRWNDALSPSTAIPETERSINLEAAGQELWNQRKRLGIAGIVTGLLGLILALLLPASYTAVAAFVPPSTSSGSSALAASLSALSILSPMKSSGELYTGILKSRSVADGMIDRFDLMKVYRTNKKSKAAKILGQKSTFDVDVKSSIITVQVTDHSPERARDMANAYLDEVRSTSSGLALTESSQRRIFFEERLAKEKNDLANAEVALKETEEKTGLIAPAGQTASGIQAVAQVRAEITGREVRLASLRRDETEENPDVQRLHNEIASLRSRLGQMMNSGSEDGAISTAKVPSLALEYIRKEREVKYHNALFEIIAKQYENARLDEAHDPPLQILDRAVTPDMKSGPPRTLIAVLGLVLGVFLEALWILFKAARGREGVVSARLRA